MTSSTLSLPVPVFASPGSAISAELADNAVHLWLLDSRHFNASHQANALQIMSSDEHERAQKVVRGQQEYIASRWLLRRVLAHYTGTTAEKIALLRTDKGKPYVPQSNLHFSLSHSGHWVVLALGAASAIGIDLESIRTRRNMLGIAQHYYHPTELAHLQSLPSLAQQDYFYRLWTLKEAFFKALGTGISAGLEKAAFALDSQSINATISPALACEKEHWQFHQWALTPDEPQQVYCALAYRNEQQLATKWFDAFALPAFP